VTVRQVFGRCPDGPGLGGPKGPEPHSRLGASRAIPIAGPPVYNEITDDDRARVAAAEVSVMDGLDREAALSAPAAPISAKSYSFGQIEVVASAMLNVPPEHRSKVDARLKNLLRKGLLPELGAQRGRAFSFTEDQALVLLLAVMLNCQGRMPEYVVFLVSRRRHLISKSAERGVPMIFHPEGDLRDLQDDPDRKHTRITEIWPIGALQKYLTEYQFGGRPVGVA
jgi:hypothetical protein